MGWNEPLAIWLNFLRHEWSRLTAVQSQGSELLQGGATGGAGGGGGEESQISLFWLSERNVGFVRPQTGSLLTEKKPPPKTLFI